MHTQLEPWLDAFPREQLLILFMEDMKTPEGTHDQLAKVSLYVWKEEGRWESPSDTFSYLLTYARKLTGVRLLGLASS